MQSVFQAQEEEQEQRARRDPREISKPAMISDVFLSLHEHF